MERLKCFFPDFLFEITRNCLNRCKNHQTAFSLTFFGKRILAVQLFNSKLSPSNGGGFSHSLIKIKGTIK